MRRGSRVLALALLPFLAVAVPASAQAPPSFETLAARAAEAREAGRLVEAADLYRAAVGRKGDWDEGLWYLGSVLYELGRHAEARAAFTTLLARQPAHAGAAGLKGLCEFEIGDHEEALRSLLHSRTLGIARTPGVANVVRYHAGLLLTRFGEFEVGYSVLAEFATENVESPHVVEAMGLNVLRLALLPAELDAARRAAVGLAGQAGLAMAGRRMAAAGPLFDELVTRFGTIANVHYARGVFRLTEAPDRALDDFTREIAVTPDHVFARLQIAFELVRRGEAAAARPFADGAVQRAPALFSARLASGIVRLELGEIGEAVAELERAAALAPGSPQAHFMLARGYARAGRREDAARARAEFTRLDQLVRAQRGGEQAIGGIPAKGTP